MPQTTAWTIVVVSVVMAVLHHWASTSTSRLLAAVSPYASLLFAWGSTFVADLAAAPPTDTASTSAARAAVAVLGTLVVGSMVRSPPNLHFRRAPDPRSDHPDEEN